MPAAMRFRAAKPAEAAVVADILHDAARWLEQAGMPHGVMWRDDEMNPARIAADVRAGLYFLAEIGGVPAATVRFQLDDPEFWPDAPRSDAAYIHRLARRQGCANAGIGAAALAWAVEHTRQLGRHALRLDCEASRTRLRALYEGFGFRHHSDRHVGPYLVSRYEYTLGGDTTPQRGGIAPP